MPGKGQKATQQHRENLSKSHKNIPNGWLGRKHTEDAKKKMRHPHSMEHIARIQLGALNRWKRYKELNKPMGWVIEPKVRTELVPPQQYESYRDIYDEGWDGIKDIL